VAWISAHVAAVHRILLPAIARGNGGRHVRRQRGIDHELLKATWQVDRALTGDVHNAAVPRDRLLQTLRALLDAHTAAEQAVLDVAARLDDGALRKLRDDLEAATMHAPTRPHPFTPDKPAGAAVFKLEALVDRVRDALDARHVPVPRRRAPRHIPGRWGLYALGSAEVEPKQPDQESRAGGRH
jgi:hypothetical protein